MNAMADDLLLRPEFEFYDGEHRGVIRRHGDETWYVYGTDDVHIGYFAVAYPVMGESEVNYTAGLLDEIDSISTTNSSDWRELAGWFLSQQ